jgi:hypothetical protein
VIGTGEHVEEPGERASQKHEHRTIIQGTLNRNRNV